MTKVEIFRELIEKMFETFKAKNADYGDSFGKSIKKHGLSASTIRIEDKLNRIESLIKKGKQEVKDESIEDTYLDMAVYSILTLVEMKFERYKSKQTELNKLESGIGNNTDVKCNPLNLAIRLPYTLNPGIRFPYIKNSINPDLNIPILKGDIRLMCILEGIEIKPGDAFTKPFCTNDKVIAVAKKPLISGPDLQKALNESNWEYITFEEYKTYFDSVIKTLQ